jgi:HD superfamily phosphohydrolase
MGCRDEPIQNRALAMAGRIPELAPPFAETAPVRLPELRNVALTRRVVAIIDHPDFQRLRRVLQLGPTALVYPGATHTRFEHSLGVFENVRAYLLHLLRDPDFADAAGEGDLLAGLLAGLLHDLGHYPFCHALEALGRAGLETDEHEAVGTSILFGRLSARSIGAALERDWGVDPQRVARLIERGPAAQDGPIDAMLASVLHSPIDADKMDYLERDSIHLGVPYGRNYDRERLLSSLAVHPASHSLAVNDKGKVSAEIFIFCRYTMFSEVYWHHAVRAVEAMAERALEDFQHQSGLDGAALIDRLLGHSDESLLDQMATTAAADSAAARLAHGLTGGRRRLHKRVLTLSQAHRRPAFRRAYERVVGIERPAARRLEQALAECLARVTGRTLRPGEVLLDAPPAGKHRLEDLPVLFGHKGSWAPLAELSHTVRGIGRDFARRVAKARVFVAAEPARAAREALGADALAERLLDAMLDAADEPATGPGASGRLF